MKGPALLLAFTENAEVLDVIRQVLQIWFVLCRQGGRSYNSKADEKFLYVHGKIIISPEP